MAGGISSFGRHIVPCALLGYRLLLQFRRSADLFPGFSSALMIEASPSTGARAYCTGIVCPSILILLLRAPVPRRLADERTRASRRARRLRRGTVRSPVSRLPSRSAPRSTGPAPHPAWPASRSALHDT